MKRNIDGQKDKWIENRWIERQMDRKIERKIDRKIDKKIDRKLDRKIESKDIYMKNLELVLVFHQHFLTLIRQKIAPIFDHAFFRLFFTTTYF